MKTIHAVDVWHAPQATPYSRATSHLEHIESLPESSYENHATARAAVYVACGAPFGPSPLARWAWWEFGQWTTTN